MHNLICFPHYTCGGLLCDILSNTFSPVTSNGGIGSISHFFGKIGDSNTVYDNYDPVELMASLANVPENTWVGTHCWPGLLTNNQFNRIIIVTTTTYKSKLYRWQRAYHNYFAPSWENIINMERTDKLRETAKNYLVPFVPVIGSNIDNIEFADIVENTAEFKYLVKDQPTQDHLDRWQQLNSFLYNSTVWTDEIAQALYQAEVENQLNRYYRYQ